MSTALLARNRNFRLLFGAGALTNLGDWFVILDKAESDYKIDDCCISIQLGVEQLTAH